MSEVWLLSLVSMHPHQRALARKAQKAGVFPGLRSLERRGLVTCYRDQYRLTRRGRDELAMAYAISRLVWRSKS
jgi:hypothetical protein